MSGKLGQWLTSAAFPSLTGDPTTFVFIHLRITQQIFSEHLLCARHHSSSEHSCEQNKAQLTQETDNKQPKQPMRSVCHVVTVPEPEITLSEAEGMLGLG